LNLKFVLYHTFTQFNRNLQIQELLTVLNYINFGTIRPISEQIVAEKMNNLSILFIWYSITICIKSIQSTSIGVRQYKYCHYLVSNRLFMTYGQRYIKETFKDFCFKALWCYLLTKNAIAFNKQSLLLVLAFLIFLIIILVCVFCR
jgi:hypothetical protein